MKGRGNKIVVGTAVKAKIGELEEEVRVGSTRRMIEFCVRKHTKTQSGNQTLKTLLPTKHRKHHDHLKINCFL